tara:strand:- start:2293 stop:2574 length:282 start_codon:yes stop_codon:yes gene_type:complete
MNWDDKKVIDHRNDIIDQLKKYSLSDKKWIIKSFWKGIIDSSALDDKTEITQKLPHKFINDQKGMILYLSLKLLLPNHIQKLEDTKFPSKEIH